MLTVAIPTFNRNHLLKACVARLLPQLGGREVLIVDNGSDIPVSTTLGGWLEEARIANVRIIRNPANVGGPANLLRCLELCRTEWMYCLGDDDLVADDCIQTIDDAIKAHPQALYMSFSRSTMRRARTFVTTGMADFVDRFDDWSTFLFMSSSILRTAPLRAEMRWGYLYAYSWAPFQALLLKGLASGGQVVFSDALLCHEESIADEMWTPFPVVAGKMVLPELIADKRIRTRFARQLQKTPSIASLIYLGALRGTASTRAQNSHFVSLYIDRCLAYQRRPILYVARVIGYVVLDLLRPPNRFVIAVLLLASRALGKSAAKIRHFSQDRS